VRVQNGRDHNSHGFSYVLAGGGIKGGTTYGRRTSSASRRSRTASTFTTCMRPCCILGYRSHPLDVPLQRRDFRLTDVAGQ